LRFGSHFLKHYRLRFELKNTYNQHLKQSMRHWRSQSDYTVIAYEGMVPRSAVVTPEGIEIPPIKQTERPEPRFPTTKEVGGLVPVAMLVEELQQTAQDYKRDFLPTTAVLGMMSRNVHRALLTRIDNIPADVDHWNDPPHVEFANCAFHSPEDVKRFVETYGFGLNMIRDPGLHYNPEPAITVSLEGLQQKQDFVRGSWGKAEHARSLQKAFLWSPDDVTFERGKPRIIIRDIWDYILVLFLIDLTAGRLKVCAHPDCRQLKYFVQERPNQKYCSVPCKNTFNINRWLSNPENRKRFNAARRKSQLKATTTRRTPGRNSRGTRSQA
jgi:hypothetical protein